MLLHLRVVLEGWVVGFSGEVLALGAKLTVRLPHFDLLLHVLACTLDAHALVEFHIVA